MIRHRHEPDVDIKPDLVAGVIGGRRPAAGLRQVADQDTVPAGGFGGKRSEFFKEIESGWDAPNSGYAKPHDLPVLAVDREFDTAGKTAARIVADRHGLTE